MLHSHSLCSIIYVCSYVCVRVCFFFYCFVLFDVFIDWRQMHCHIAGYQNFEILLDFYNIARAQQRALPFCAMHVQLVVCTFLALLQMIEKNQVISQTKYVNSSHLVSKKFKKNKIS